MTSLQRIGALALATAAVAIVAGCDRDSGRADRVVERTTVVREQPVIVRQDADRHEGDRPDQDRRDNGDRRDGPPPPDRPGDHPNDRPVDHRP